MTPAGLTHRLRTTALGETSYSFASGNQLEIPSGVGIWPCVCPFLPQLKDPMWCRLTCADLVHADPISISSYVHWSCCV